MRQQLGKSSWRALAYITLILFVSACGSSKRGNLYSGTQSGPQTVIPTVNPFINGSTFPPPVTNNSSVTLAASPSQISATGSTISLFASGASNNSYNFQFSSNPIGATFVGNSQGVASVGVTSSYPGSVTISANDTTGAASATSITVTFTGSAVNYPSSSLCSIQGPYAISSYSYPQVGGSYYFAVQKNSMNYYGVPEQLKIINVWTQDPSEIGRYYYAWDKFWMTFNSAGSKTIFVRAQSLTTGSTCDAQITLSVAGSYVSPTPGPVPGGSCGMSPATGLGYCSQVAAYTYYFDGYSCQAIWTENSCRPKGPFETLYQCQYAVARGQCGGSGTTTTPSIRNVYVDSKSTQWTDTGVDIVANSYSGLAISTTGLINYSRSASVGPDGVSLSNFNQCKDSNAQSLPNAALIGKIGVSGSPFLVGSRLTARVLNSSGRLYLLVNDNRCASDNVGTFLASIQFSEEAYYSTR